MKLAIKGHAERGNEVIKILEILGGNNANNCCGKYYDRVYYINENGYIDQDFISHIERNTKFIIFSLEEFLEKFPYKVGDKVKAWINGRHSICNIQNMQWDSLINEIEYKIQDYWYSAMTLQPYKEETMEQIKIDIAELLKDCPKGTKLYSPIFGEVYLDKIRPHLAIVVTTDKEQGDFKEEFLYDGRYGMNGECMLFPSKGKTTWEGFVPPCKFKDGDVMATDSGMWVGIVKKLSGGDTYEVYVGINTYYTNSLKYGSLSFSRPATEEEKQKLFDAIKVNGYKWNEETKTLEELIEPKFKVGDMIQDVDKYKVKITEVNIEDECYGYKSMIAKGIGGIPFKEQNNWELVLNKFDVTTLKPFDKVLVRCSSLEKWHIQFFEKYNTELGAKYPFICLCYNKYSQCIPYENNQHLLDTANDCDEYYKTWE